MIFCENKKEIYGFIIWNNKEKMTKKGRLL